MSCTQAEILRLLRLIEKRVIEPARDIEDLRRRWAYVKATIEERTLEELESQLGLAV